MMEANESELSSGISSAATLSTELEGNDLQASQLAQVLRGQRCSNNEGDLLEVKANLISSVKWLSLHVPVCVLNRLGDEIYLRRKDDSERHDDGSS